jgi:polyhydroxyalkanoate synthesis regulator phasin
MARIALGATLLFLLATCFFTFETKSKVGQLAANADQYKSDAAQANQKAATAGAKLQAALDEATKAKGSLQDAQDATTAAQGKADAATAQVDGLNKQIADLQAQVANKPVATPPPVVQGPTQDEFNKAVAAQKDAEAQLAEQKTINETLVGQTKDAKTRADDLQKEVDQVHNRAMRNGLEGEVLAVNGGWNFVVLSIGDRQGAVTNAEMILERGGSQIGKVRITSVEPSTSVADIIPGTLARGVQVQPGDRVIFPGS